MQKIENVRRKFEISAISNRYEETFDNFIDSLNAQF